MSFEVNTIEGADSTTQTDAAKALVRAVVRAFYDDRAVVVVDFLLDAKFLRDGNGMGDVLHLKTKQVKSILAFLQSEHLVALQCVEGRVETRDKNRTYRRTERANFWYLDLNKAVNTIKLRLKMIQSKLESDINKAVSTSTYQCPGYLSKACNGLYTEMEVQRCPIADSSENGDGDGGGFLCQECVQVHKHNPNPPPVSSYLLKLVDNSQAKKDAEDKLRRFQTQMSSKKINDDEQLRPGIYDLLQKVQDLTAQLKIPVTSNLPSDNGAQDVLIGQVLYDTTNFNTEAAEEFSNTIYVRGNDGQRMVLDIELGSGLQADYWAREGPAPPHHIVHGIAGELKEEEEEAEGEQSSSTTIPKPINERTASIDALHPIPKPKRVCRNTTPYFLKEGIRKNPSVRNIPKPKSLTNDDPADGGMDELTNATRQMSIDLDVLDMDEQEANNAASTSTSTFGKTSDKDTCILWQSMKDSKPDRASVQQYVQQIVKNAKTTRTSTPTSPKPSLRRASSFPPHNYMSASCTFESMDTASSMFNSVEWQSGDTAGAMNNLWDPAVEEKLFAAAAAEDQDSNNKDNDKDTTNSQASAGAAGSTAAGPTATMGTLKKATSTASAPPIGILKKDTSTATTGPGGAAPITMMGSLDPQSNINHAAILQSWGNVEQFHKSMDVNDFMTQFQSKDSSITPLMRMASLSQRATSMGMASIDMLDSLYPNLQQNSSDGIGTGAGAGGPGGGRGMVDFGASIRNMLQSTDNGASYNNIMQEAQNAITARANLETVLPHLKSLDAFAMNMGSASNKANNNNKSDPSGGGSKNKAKKPMNKLTRQQSADLIAMLGSADLDTLSIFKSSEGWEDMFPSKDDLGLAWQVSNPMAPTNDMAAHGLSSASSTDPSQRSGVAKPEYLRSQDWMKSMVGPAQGDVFDTSIFQSTEKPQSSAAKPRKTNSMERYMQMYRNQLQPTLQQQQQQQPKFQGPSPTVTAKAMADILSSGWPTSPTPTPGGASLFPPFQGSNMSMTVGGAPPSSPQPYHHSPTRTGRSPTKQPPVKASRSPKKPGTSGGGRKTGIPDVKVFVEYTDIDVLCQRGTKSRLHPGNERYRSLVESSKPEYRSLQDKYMKTKFAEDLVKKIQEYGGRFLEKDKETGGWYIIPDNVARRKAGQALRDDNTPEARKAKREKYSKKNND